MILHYVSLLDVVPWVQNTDDAHPPALRVTVDQSHPPACYLAIQRTPNNAE